MSNLHSERGWRDEEYLEKGQLENWNNLRTATNAIRYKFDNDLHPNPRQTTDTESVEGRMERIEAEWTKEWTKRGVKKNESPTPRFASMPKEAQNWLDSVLTRSAPIQQNLQQWYDLPYD